jgi:hypothetical protein
MRFKDVRAGTEFGLNGRRYIKILTVRCLRGRANAFHESIFFGLKTTTYVYVTARQIVSD